MGSEQKPCDLIALVLNYNNWPDTARCINSFLADPQMAEKRLVVIDNGSTDDSEEFIRSSYPNIEILKHSTNLGFAEGFNRAITKLIEEHPKSFLLLNNDVVVHPNSIQKMLLTLGSVKNVGVVGPAVLYMGSRTIHSMGVSIDLKTGRSVGRFNRLGYDSVSPSVDDVDYVQGCAMLVKRDVFEKVGLFASHFFLYAEEVDLCLRAKKCGFRVVCDSNAVIEHREGSTTNRYPEMKVRLQARNKILLLKRHGRARDLMYFALWTTATELPLMIVRALRYEHSIRGLASWSRGNLEGIANSLNEPRL